jgi:branched-chain amino acid transport system substrate-binding protein
MGPYIFRNSIMEADIIPTTLKVATKKFNLKKVAVIWGNDDAFTKGSYDVFKKALEDQKMEVTTTETFAKGDVDFRAQLTKIKATKPDAIIASALAEEAANILLQARQLGIKVPFIGGNGFNSSKLFEIAKDAADNSIMGGPWSSESDTKINKAFVQGYMKDYNGEPDQFAAQAYDAMYLVADALKKIKLTNNIENDREALRLALPNVQIEGATGKFKFRKASKGGDVGYDAEQDAHVFISKGGKFILLK